jgi:hypothetical protein
VLNADPKLDRALRAFRDPEGRFHLHPVQGHDTAEAMRALGPLDFAGALVFGEEAQALALKAASRSSLDAQEVGAADTLTTAVGGMIAEFNFGRAVGSCLRAAGWDGRSAKAVLLGTGGGMRGVARELSSLGVARLTILAKDRPTAEQAHPPLAASTEVIARAAADPLSAVLLRDADLVVRFSEAIDVPDEAMGPHLTLLDLSDTGVSALRTRAIGFGALTFNRADVLAHALALGLSHILGGSIAPDGLLASLHDA